MPTLLHLAPYRSIQRLKARIICLYRIFFVRIISSNAWIDFKIMPHISSFFGILIRMFYNEHNPPHFHAEYQSQRGVFDLDGNFVKGSLKSKTAQQLIKRWAILHKNELESNWEKIEKGTQLNKIAPLD